MSTDIDYGHEPSTLEAELKDHLYELRRISRAEADLKKAREKHTEVAVALLKELGNIVIEDPIDGKPRYATVIEAETLVVDAAELYEALLEQYAGDVDEAEMVWKSVLKSPAVDTKEDGLFAQACVPRDVNDPNSGLVNTATIYRVAKWKKSKGYVSFGKPGAA